MVRRVLGVLNGGDLPLYSLEKWANSATNLYAADGAADRLLALGYRPIVVGDGDSGSRDRWPSDLEVRIIQSQESSDTDKLMEAVALDGHDSLVLAGIEGDNPMHTLANLHSAVKSAIPTVLRYRRFDGWIVKSGQPWSRSVPDGRKISLIPLVECQGVSLSGVQWPLDDAALSLGERISLSNLSSGEVRVSLSHGAALILVKREDHEEPPWS